MLRRRWFRVVSVFMASVMAFSASAEGLHAMALGAGSLAHPMYRALQGGEPAFFPTPGPIEYGTNPSLDPVYQNGVWDDDGLVALYGLEQGSLAASQVSTAPLPIVAPENQIADPVGYEDTKRNSKEEPEAPPSELEANLSAESMQGNFGITGGGVPYPWQSSFPGGGSNGVDTLVNTSTGNRLTTVPLFSFPVRGGLSLTFNLYHNSKTGYVSPSFGQKWSSDFEAVVHHDHTNPNNISNIAILRWGNGQMVRFTRPSQAGNWSAPSGLYDKLTNSFDGVPIMLVTTKSQVKYKFKKFHANDNFYALWKIEDRDGNTITVEREENSLSKRITRVVDPVGRAISFGYLNGKCVEVKDWRVSNRKWNFEYPSASLFRIKYPAVGTSGSIFTREFTYDVRNNIIQEKDRRGKIWACGYDSSDRLTSFHEPGLVGAPPYVGYQIIYQASKASLKDPYDTSALTYEVHNYDAGRIVSEVDDAGYSSFYGWDALRKVSFYTDRNGGQWQYESDAMGNVTKLTTPTNEKTYYEYNADNTLKNQKTDLANSKVVYSYNSTGRPIGDSRAWDQYGTPWFARYSAQYTAQGVLLSVTNIGQQSGTYNFSPDAWQATIKTVTDPGNNVSTYNHNELGWLNSVVRPLIGTTTILRDSWGRVTKVTNADGTFSQVQYDEENNITQVIDERSKTHSWTYDDRGLPLTYTNANGEVESYAHNFVGFLHQVTNARGKVRTYTPNVRYEIMQLQLADGSVEAWTYNGEGDVTIYSPALLASGYQQHQIKYSYDLSGRPTKVDYYTGTDTTFTYTNFGHTVAMTDSTGTTTWTYGSWGDLMSLVTPQGTFNYQYQPVGGDPRSSAQLLKTTEVGVGDTTYTYDNMQRVISMTNPHGETTAWEYDAAGRVKKRTLGNGTWEDITYTGNDNMRSRPTSVTLRKPGNITLKSQSYTYDNASNVLSHVLDGVSTTYEYDNINQLTREYKGPSATPTWEIKYQYDANGNRSRRTILGGPDEIYTNDDADKLTSVTWAGGSKTFTYDALGRRETMATGGVTTTYTWDAESRLKEIRENGVLKDSYAYNGLDARVSASGTWSGSKTFRRNGAYATDPVTSDGSATFTPGVSERRGGTSTFLHSGLKNADGRTGSAQTVTGTRTYDAFGNVIGTTGTWNGPFGYAGSFGYQEDGSGLKLLGHRYYDPSVGRFLSRDPIGDGRNWFTYCENNPLNAVDPNGLQKWIIVAIERGGIQGSGRHVRVGLYDDTKYARTTKWYGFYNDGKVQAEKDGPSESASFYAIPVSDEKYDEVMAEINSDMQSKRAYNPQHANCAAYVYSLLVRVKILNENSEDDYVGSSAKGFTPSDLGRFLKDSLLFVTEPPESWGPAYKDWGPFRQKKKKKNSSWGKSAAATWQYGIR